MEIAFEKGKRAEWRGASDEKKNKVLTVAGIILSRYVRAAGERMGIAETERERESLMAAIFSQIREYF